VSLVIVPTWKQVTPMLQAELVAFWGKHKLIGDPVRAAERSRQAVCIGRDGSGEIVAAGTAHVRVLPRLRQPLYYYRQYFAPQLRGQRQALPFFEDARALLQEFNAALEEPESLGLLLELDNPMLAAHYTKAWVESANAVFIGYSPRRLQLRVSYFDGARLLDPADIPRRTPAYG